MARGQTARDKQPPPLGGLQHDHQQHGDEQGYEGEVGRRAAHLGEDVGGEIRAFIGKDQICNHQGVDRRHKDRSRGHVLGDLGLWVEGTRHHIDDGLDGRVQHLGDEHEHYREEDGQELRPGEVEEEASEQHEHRHAHVNAHVALATEDVHQSLEGVVEAAQQGRTLPVLHPHRRQPRERRDEISQEGSARISDSLSRISPWSTSWS